MSSKPFVVGALVLAGALASGVAQARGGDDVYWSVTIGAPVGVPVYRQPPPIYVRPAPVVVPVHPYPRHGYVQPTRWDRDGDGIPNRYDRVYNPRRDRDGDGVPNWRERGDGLGHRGDR